MSTSPAATEAPPPASPTGAFRTATLVPLLRLGWFIRLRWVFVLAVFGVLALERFLQPEGTRPWQLGAIVCGVAVINVVWIAISRSLQKHFEVTDVGVAKSIRSAQVFANAQVAADLLLLTLILRYTGGVENPMMMFYVFHIAISALVLEKVQAILQAVWAVVLYTSMALGELFGWLTPHAEFLPGLASPGWYRDPNFVPLAVMVLACGVFGLLYFMLRVAARLDARDRQLVTANAALRRSKTAIQDLQVRRSRFMQTAAHQLKSPLAVIQTLASLIREEIVPPESIRATMEKITKRCQDGITQVTELLTLARVQEANPQRHNQALTNIADVVVDLCRHYKPVAEGKDVALSWRVPEGCDFDARVDPRDASDCIGNLIDNAIKYTPGPGTVTVKLACVEGRPNKHPAGRWRRQTGRGESQNDAYVYVSVRDTGIGFDKDALSEDRTSGPGSIFEPFRRGNSALAAGIPGTGLGLSIVREVVEQAGGRISVYSRPGKGSTFTVMFPAQRSPVTEPAIPDTRASEIVIEDSDADAEKKADPAATGAHPDNPGP